MFLILSNAILVLAGLWFLLVLYKVVWPNTCSPSRMDLAFLAILFAVALAVRVIPLIDRLGA